MPSEAIQSIPIALAATGWHKEFEKVNFKVNLHKTSQSPFGEITYVKPKSMPSSFLSCNFWYFPMQRAVVQQPVMYFPLWYTSKMPSHLYK